MGQRKTLMTAIVLVASLILFCAYIIWQGVDIGYFQAGILKILLCILSAAIIYCIMASILTENYSQVDRLWSILPVVYAWVISYCDGFEWRSLLVAVLISLWGIRLSYNFYLKGGYNWLPWKGTEDYRWEYLRNQEAFRKPYVWQAFNIFFISIYQLSLILYFTLPALLTVNMSQKAFNMLDALALLLFLASLIVETVADRQQFRFQSAKYDYLGRGIDPPEPYKKGFIDSGLWKYVRHPNYAAEQMIWFSIYLMGVSASGMALNWTIGGWILLVLLFRGSSDFSENISREKYPGYSSYIKATGRFFPKLF